MNALLIEQTKNTPKISFEPDNNCLIITGQSFCDNAIEFYEPVFSWLDEYLMKLNTHFTLNLTLYYLNTSSIKCIMLILEKLEYAFKKGTKITVNWYYEEDDDSLKEVGEDFKEDLTLPFNIISISTE